MRGLKLAGQGKERLWKVFWAYGVAVSCVGFVTALTVEIGTAMSVGVVGTHSLRRYRPSRLCNPCFAAQR